MNISGTPTIDNFDNGSDPDFNEFHFLLNDGSPLSAEEAMDILVDEKTQEDTLEKVDEFGCASALVSGSIKHKKLNVLPVPSHHTPFRTVYPHNHEGSRAFMLFMEPGSYRNTPTITMGRAAISRVLLEMGPEAVELADKVSQDRYLPQTPKYKNLFKRLQEAESEDDFYDNLISELIFHLVYGLGGIDGLTHQEVWREPRGHGRKFMRDLIAAIPGNAKFSHSWMKKKNMGRILIFNTRRALHCSGVLADPNKFKMKKQPKLFVFDE